MKLSPLQKYVESLSPEQKAFLAHMRAGTSHLDESPLISTAILLDGQVFKADMSLAMIWDDDGQKRIVKKDFVGDTEISTVFLVTGYPLWDNPCHFETMTFGPEESVTEGRYHTLEQARAGHEAAVWKVRSQQTGAT